MYGPVLQRRTVIRVKPSSLELSVQLQLLERDRNARRIWGAREPGRSGEQAAAVDRIEARIDDDDLVVRPALRARRIASMTAQHASATFLPHIELQRSARRAADMAPLCLVQLQNES
ncbi:hypothetical protein AURDEDRAFT_174984 [Auricularia subglabra TFB-10046 SS5]|nr:hypothetical protein AURDEDRAFT_174984 [Auricularia subglabra TFB-10046 SS5]